MTGGVKGNLGVEKRYRVKTAGRAWLAAMIPTLRAIGTPTNPGTLVIATLPYTAPTRRPVQTAPSGLAGTEGHFLTLAY